MFIVVKNDGKCLLGMKTLNTLRFVTVHNDQFISRIETNDSLGDLGEANLRTDPSIKPRQLPCRKIPFAIQYKVKMELDLIWFNEAS